MLHETETSFIAESSHVIRAMLLADPVYQAWSEQRQSDNERQQDDWLASPDGEAWLNNEAEIELERRCLSPWSGW